MIKPELDEALEYYYCDDVTCLLHYIDWYLFSFINDEDFVITTINLFKQHKISSEDVDNMFYEMEPDLYCTTADIDNGSIYLMNQDEFIEEFILPNYEDEEEMENKLGDTDYQIISNYLEHDYNFTRDMVYLDDIESVLIVEN